MKAIGINGSPRMKSSSTWHIMQPFLEGLQDAGWETEVIHVRQLDLQPCIGCFNCWVRTPGVCIHRDGMSGALERYNQADLVVYGTPLYHFTMSGLLKTFIDRATLPRIEPWLVDEGTITGHPQRFDKPKQMFLISPCGFPEFDHFDALVDTFKFMAKMTGLDYLGEILRPAADSLSRPAMQHFFGDYYAMVRQAGEQIGREGGLSDALQAQLHRDLFPGGIERFRQNANAYWTEMMDRNHVPEADRHTPPLLSDQLDGDLDGKMAELGARMQERSHLDNETLLRMMAAMYNPLAIPDLRVTIQFQFLPPSDFDPGPAEWYLSIADGLCSVHPGRTTMPTLSIASPTEVWRQIGGGKLDAKEAFAHGQFEVTGSQQLLGDFPRLFDYLRPAGAGTGPDPELDALLLGMPQTFDAQAAGDLQAIVQFVLGGAGGGMYYLRIDKGRCSAHPGLATEPTMSIYGPAAVWLRVARGELDGKQALTTGQYRVIGDLSLLMRFNALFKAS